MPQLPEDFQDIREQMRHALCLYVHYDGDWQKALIDAGYISENKHLKQTWRRFTKVPRNIRYMNWLQTHPDKVQEELDWFNRLKRRIEPISKGFIECAKNLTPENRVFLEQYFLHGNRTKAMLEAGFKGDEAYLRKKASAILRNDTSIVYMTELNDRALQELFLSKSKIIKEVYELAKESKDSKSRFAAVKAYELLGRMVGLLDDKKSVNIQDGGKIEINYVVPDKLDTKLHEDIDKFLREGREVKDVEWKQYNEDDGDKDGR